MDFSFDPAKNARNVDVHGISFESVSEFDWPAAVVIEDVRWDYGERRYRATSFIGDRLHVLVYTPRGESVHVISLRKANRRERRLYGAQVEEKESG